MSGWKMGRRENWAAEVEQKYEPIARLADVFVVGAKVLFASGEILQSEELKIVVALLFGRISNGADASIRLIKLGFMTEADVLYRSNLEALFRMAALIKDAEMLVCYKAEDYVRRREAMSDIRALLLTLDPRPADAVSESDLDQTISQIDREANEFRKRNNEAPLKKVSTWEWAKASGQLDFFYGKYLMHSNAAHHAIRDIQRHLHIAESGVSLKAISMDIEVDEPGDAIAETLWLLARAIGLHAGFMGVQIPDELIEGERTLKQEFGSGWANTKTGSG